MLAVISQRNFTLLWMARLISLIGDWMLFIALPLYVYTLTNSTLSTGIMFMTQMIPRILLGSVAGVFVDRWNKKGTMVLADVCRAVLLLALLMIRSLEELWILYLVSFFQSAFSQFYGPANSALIPCLVDKYQLMAANSVRSITDNITRLISPVLGGALVGVIGIANIFLLDALSYFMSGILTLLIIVPKDISEDTMSATYLSYDSIWKRAWREWLDGLSVMQDSAIIRTIFIVIGVAMFAQGIIDVLFVVFVRDILRGGALEFGLIETSQGIGGLLGGLILGKSSKAIKTLHLIAIGLGGTGVFFLLSVNVPFLPVVLFFTMLIGIPVVFFLVSIETSLQVQVASQYRGRVFGAYSTNIGLMLLLGMAVASLLGTHIHVMTLLNGAGVLYLLASLLVFVRHRRMTS